MAGASATTPTAWASPRAFGAAWPTRRASAWCRWARAAPARQWPCALLAEGVERLVLFDVDPARAQALADNLNQHFGAPRALAGSDLAGALGDAQGLVNTTPVGMAKLPGMPVPAELLRADLWVAEVIYFPLETELLRQARALGCRTLDGGTMAVFQAVKAFELFSGVTADAARMQAHFASLGD